MTMIHENITQSPEFVVLMGEGGNVAQESATVQDPFPIKCSDCGAEWPKLKRICDACKFKGLENIDESRERKDKIENGVRGKAIFAIPSQKTIVSLNDSMAKRAQKDVTSSLSVSSASSASLPPPAAERAVEVDATKVKSTEWFTSYAKLPSAAATTAATTAEEGSTQRHFDILLNIERFLLPCVMRNPNSEDAIREVFEHLKRHGKLAGTDGIYKPIREWFYVVSDEGAHFPKLFEDGSNKNILHLPGTGHEFAADLRTVV